MATLQKFKLLATQCAISTSPSRSPNASPVFQLRRRKTLKRLLSRSSNRRPEPGSDRPEISAPDPPETKALLSHTLKDLFVSSPPPPPPDEERGSAAVERRIGIGIGIDGRVGTATGRGVSRAFRYRILRRLWRPVLLTIPE